MRSEATLQADLRQLVLTAPFSLSAEDVVTADLETPVGVRRRIDIEVGSCLIEVKRDLAVGGVLEEAKKQLADYLEARQKETGCRYVGILTDGADWRCVCRRGGDRPAARGLGLPPRDPAGCRVVPDLAGGRAGHGPGRPGDPEGDPATAGGGEFGPRPGPRHAAGSLHAAPRPSRRADEAAALGPAADDRPGHPVRGQGRAVRRAHVPREHGRGHRPRAGRLRPGGDRAGVAAQRRQVRGERHLGRRRGGLLRLGRPRPGRRAVRPVAGPPRGPLPLAEGRRRCPEGALRVGHHGGDPQAPGRVLHARLARRADRRDRDRGAAQNPDARPIVRLGEPSSSTGSGATSRRPRPRGCRSRRRSRA